MSLNTKLGYITLIKNILGLSTDQTYSLFETLFQVSSDSQEFYALMKIFDEYGTKIYQDTLTLKSFFLSVPANEQEGDSDVSEEDMEDFLQGSPKKINTSEVFLPGSNNLVVLDTQRKVLQVKI